MIVKLLTEHHLEFLNLKEAAEAPLESTLVKMSNCWKSHATAQIIINSKLSWEKKHPIMQKIYKKEMQQ